MVSTYQENAQQPVHFVWFLQLSGNFGTYANFEIHSSIEIALKGANQQICINA